MNTVTQILSVLVVLGVLAILAIPAARHRLSLTGKAFAAGLFNFCRALTFIPALLANDGALTAGEHAGARVSGFHDNAPQTVRFLLVKQGSADNKWAVPTSIADMPVGVCIDEPAATTDPVTIQLLNGCDKTQKMVGNGVINAGNILVTNGDGYVKALPNVAGIYWSVGVAVTSTLATGDIVEVQPSLNQVGVSIVT